MPIKWILNIYLILRKVIVSNRIIKLSSGLILSKWMNLLANQDGTKIMGLGTHSLYSSGKEGACSRILKGGQD